VKSSDFGYNINSVMFIPENSSFTIILKNLEFWPD